MTLERGLFIVFGAITLGAALLVVTRRNLLHAASFLILSFFSVAGLYVLLEAHFLVAVQLFICIGGIAILLIYPTLLTQGTMAPNTPGANRQWWAAALVTAALCGVLGWVVLNHDWPFALEWYLILAAALFCIGGYGVLSRRNGIAILMAVGLMLSGVNINLVAFWRYLEPGGMTGQAFALFVYAVAAAEAAVGLTLIIALRRTHNTIILEDINLLKD